MKRLAYLTRTGPAFNRREHGVRVVGSTMAQRACKIPRVAQRTLFPIREGLHASPEAWEKFTERAKRDGVTIGQIFRAVIYGYGDGKAALELPPKPPGKK